MRERISEDQTGCPGCFIRHDVPIRFNERNNGSTLLQLARNHVARYGGTWDQDSLAHEIHRSEGVHQAFSDILLRNKMHVQPTLFRSFKRCSAYRRDLKPLDLTGTIIA